MQISSLIKKSLWKNRTRFWGVTKRAVGGIEMVSFCSLPLCRSSLLWWPPSELLWQRSTTFWRLGPSWQCSAATSVCRLTSLLWASPWRHPPCEPPPGDESLPHGVQPLYEPPLHGDTQHLTSDSPLPLDDSSKDDFPPDAVQPLYEPRPRESESWRSASLIRFCCASSSI